MVFCRVLQLACDYLILYLNDCIFDGVVILICSTIIKEIYYGKLTGFQLSEIAANKMSPWFQVWNKDGGEHGVVIPNDLIEAHFRGRLNYY